MSIGRLSGVVIQAGVVLWMVSPSTPAAAPSTDVYGGQATITIVGQAGTFGPPKREVTPSGQRLGRLAVPEWAFPAARKPGTSVLAGDGTLLMAAVSHNDSLTVPTSPEMAVVAYNPRTNTSETIKLASTPGVVSGKGMLVAPTVTGLVALPNGAVAFTAWAEGIDNVPVFGLLTKVDGHWRLMPGNRWTARALGISGLRGLTRLPFSGDLVIAHDPASLTSVKIVPPDLNGQYKVVLRRTFNHAPEVTMREVHADPTGQQGAERLVAAMDRPDSPPVLQEFTYDQASGELTVLSAPLLPGDVHADTKLPFGYQTGVYDHMGNLWAARGARGIGGRLAIYTRARCKPDFTPWGKACRPDYDIIQAAELRWQRALIEDPASGTMILMTAGGLLMPVRVKASGNGLDFEIGNLVDIGGKLLTDGESSSVDSRGGVVDRDGHLWFPTSRAAHNEQGTTFTQHWLFAVNVGTLFDPPPTRLPDVPSRRVTIETESTTTVSTKETKGVTAAVEVHSDAYFAECTDGIITGCSYDTTPGNGFYLLDESHFGRLDGTLTYRVDVSSAGHYRLTYQVATWAPSTKATIKLTVGGREYLTAVATNGDWRPVRSNELVWFEAGVQTITLEPTKTGGGWFLNSLTLQRV